MSHCAASRGESASNSGAGGLREATNQLERLARERPELSELARFHRELLAVMFQADRDLPQWPQTDDLADAWGSGVPLFRLHPPTLNAPALAARWGAICSLLERYRDPEQPRRLAGAVVAQSIHPARSLQTVFDAGPNSLEAEFAIHGLDAALGFNVLRLCALPSLARLVATLPPRVQQFGESRGSCPVCGSWPLLAETRGLEQFRWLRCGLCSAGWRIDRLFCPFCQSRDYRQLLELFVEGEEQRLRVAVCDACRGLVRGISTLTPLTAPALLVADLETLHLELLAQQRGFGVSNS